MSVLAKSNWQEVAACHEREADWPAHTFLRKPETGLMMVRGRISGSGQPFNVGEVTVTRCSIQLQDGTSGHAYVMGRNQKHAEVAAVYDALLQKTETRSRIMAEVIDPLAENLNRQRVKTQKMVADTKVEFFTLVRGDD